MSINALKKQAKSRITTEFWQCTTRRHGNLTYGNLTKEKGVAS
jgi:hypothetical protein